MVVWLSEGSNNDGLVECAVTMLVWLGECSHNVGLVG